MIINFPDPQQFAGQEIIIYTNGWTKLVRSGTTRIITPFDDWDSNNILVPLLEGYNVMRLKAMETPSTVWGWVTVGLTTAMENLPQWYDPDASDGLNSFVEAGHILAINPNIVSGISQPAWLPQNHPTLAGLVGATGAQGPSGVPGSGSGSAGSPMVWVLSVDTPTDVKTALQSLPNVFVCTGSATGGTSDATIINSAIDYAAGLTANGSSGTHTTGTATQAATVKLGGGHYKIGGSTGIRMRTGVRLEGSGWMTELRAVSCTAPGIINLYDANAHACHVSNLFLNGNSTSGGSCSGIDFNMTGSTNAGVAVYPNTDPDSYHLMTDLYIRNFAGGTRHGIRLFCTSTANLRGWIIDRIQIRIVSGHGIYTENASDGFISNVHIGNATLDGFRIWTANVKMANNKAFYCDGWGMNWESQYGVCTGLEVQDCVNGVRIGFDNATFAGLVIDACRDEGLLLDSSVNDISVTGFVIGRNGSRFATMSNGVRFVTGVYAVTMIGTVKTNVTGTRVNNLAGITDSFVRITGATPVIALPAEGSGGGTDYLVLDEGEPLPTPAPAEGTLIVRVA